jgi:predicted metal-dependent hydrolase
MTMRSSRHDQIELGGRRVDYRLIVSRSARKLRVRVGTNGIEVLQPANRSDDDVVSFLEGNRVWILDQLHRVERLRKIRLPERHTGEILFRGERTVIRIEEMRNNFRGNRVSLVDGDIVVQSSLGSRVPAWRSLENWLRGQARAEIEKHVSTVCARLRQSPRRIYIMGQRTKWGNCSSQRNLVQLAAYYGA